MVFEVILELFTIISPCTSVEHVLLKIHHCTYRARKMEFMHNFGMNDLLLQKNHVSPGKFPNDLFYYCTNSLSSQHILNHHCTFCASLHVKTSPASQHFLSWRDSDIQLYNKAYIYFFIYCDAV